MPKLIGITDINGREVVEGDSVRISIEGFSNDRSVTIAKGIIEYKGLDIGCLGCLGCGYGLVHNGSFMFLATFSGRCLIEVQHD